MAVCLCCFVGWECSEPGCADHGDERISAPVTLSQRDAQELVRLLGVLGAPRPDTATDRLGHFPDLANYSTREIARSWMLVRNLRTEFLPRSLFGEPAWDLLVALFVWDDTGSPMAVSELAKLVDAPASTAVRWMQYLEEKGLVVRRRSDRDRRILKVSLSDEGRRRLDAYFQKVIRRFSSAVVEQADADPLEATQANSPAASYRSDADHKREIV